MITSVSSPIQHWKEQPLAEGQIAMWWLGQAGFLLRTPVGAWIVDPYLSSSLEAKYRDAYFPHKRMMPVPIAPSEISGLKWIFSTHHHTDHMDIGTLPDLVTANPLAGIIAPAAAAGHMTNVLGVDSSRVTFVRQDQHLSLAPGFDVHTVHAAHEELETDEAGNAVHLGYVFTIHGITIYHSGDCVPYPGLAPHLKQLHIQVALLPVNGRDEQRQRHGVPGNFHFEEAVELCHEADIPTLIPHHFGMFSFNTADPEVLKQKIAGLSDDITVQLPEIGRAMLIN